MRLSLPHSSGWLDRRLAAGARPEESPALRRRARMLRSDRKRRALAAGIARLIREADAPAGPLTSAVPIQRDAVRTCRPLLLMIAQDVQDTKLP
jgi:hypothetical protein